MNNVQEELNMREKMYAYLGKKSKLSKELNNCASSLKCNIKVSYSKKFISFVPALVKDYEWKNVRAKLKVRNRTNVDPIICHGWESGVYRTYVARQRVYNDWLAMYVFRNNFKRIENCFKEILVDSSKTIPFDLNIGRDVESLKGSYLSNTEFKELTTGCKQPMPKITITKEELIQNYCKEFVLYFKVYATRYGVSFKSTEIELSEDFIHMLIKTFNAYFRKNSNIFLATVEDFNAFKEYARFNFISALREETKLNCDRLDLSQRKKHTVYYDSYIMASSGIQDILGKSNSKTQSYLNFLSNRYLGVGANTYNINYTDSEGFAGSFTRFKKEFFLENWELICLVAELFLNKSDYCNNKTAWVSDITAYMNNNPIDYLSYIQQMLDGKNDFINSLGLNNSGVTFEEIGAGASYRKVTEIFAEKVKKLDSVGVKGSIDFFEIIKNMKTDMIKAKLLGM